MKQRLLCPECGAPLNIEERTTRRAEAYWTMMGLTWWPHSHSTIRTLYCSSFTCKWEGNPSAVEAWNLPREEKGD